MLSSYRDTGQTTPSIVAGLLWVVLSVCKCLPQYLTCVMMKPTQRWAWFSQAQVCHDGCLSCCETTQLPFGQGSKKIHTGTENTEQWHSPSKPNKAISFLLWRAVVIACPFQPEIWIQMALSHWTALLNTRVGHSFLLLEEVMTLT